VKKYFVLSVLLVIVSTQGFSQAEDDPFFTEADLNNLPPSAVIDQPVYYHIQVYSRTNKRGNIITFDVDEKNIIQNDIEYIFYHKNFGYAFFVYATKGPTDAVEASFGAIPRFDWKGTDRAMLGVLIDKIVAKHLLTIPSEVARLKRMYSRRLHGTGR
jgi:hypothetical protein